MSTPMERIDHAIPLLEVFEISEAEPSKGKLVAGYRFDYTFSLVLIGVIFALSLYVFCILL